MQNSINKIKIAMVTNHFEVTGISTVILNYCKALKYSFFDLTVIAGNPISIQNKNECENYRIKLIELPSRYQNPKAHYFQMWQVMKKNKYDIVHIHGSSSMMVIELTLAKMAGIKKRIAHSHNSTCPNIRMHRILNPYFRKSYTKALACGVLAGEWLFGENQFEVLPNGFTIKQFQFNASERKNIRRKLNLENKFIIGHVGRFNNQKNQSYLLDVFEKVAERNSSAELLLVGTGPDFEKMSDLVKKHPYKDHIILYGESNNMVGIYSAIDIFVLPSRYEGLPIVLLEAQISGLPCIVSDKVTKEIDFGNITWLSIENTHMLWADTILNIHLTSISERSVYISKHQDQIMKYDIENTIQQLVHIYKELINKK